MVINDHSTMTKYKSTMADCIRLFMPNIRNDEIYPIIDYSINKRYKEEKCKITNSYTKKSANMTLLQVADYIRDREPIVTAFGTMFKRHGTVPNPLATVIQQFIDLRGLHKDEMLKFPKGSEDYERYNLYQLLDKIDTNGELPSYAALG